MMSKRHFPRGGVAKRSVPALQVILKGVFATTLGLTLATTLSLHLPSIFVFSTSRYVAAAIGTWLSYLTLVRLVYPVWIALSVSLRWVLLATIILVATTITTVFLAGPTSLAFRLEAGPQRSLPAAFFQGQSWGTRLPAFELHANGGLHDVDTIWPWRATADLWDVVRGTGAQVSFHLTQPEWVVIDPSTAEAFQGPDGLLVVFKVERDGAWQILKQVELDLHARPEQRYWHTVEVDLPAYGEHLAIEVLPGPPGSNNWNDRVWIGVSGVRAAADHAPARLAVNLADIVSTCWLCLLAFTLLTRLSTGLSGCACATASTGPPHNADHDAETAGRWPGARRRTRYSLAATLLLAIGALPAAIAVAPWFNAGALAVQLALDAPRDADIEICWSGDAADCLPLVPNVDATQERASLWLGELPPRPAYDLTIVFASPLRDAVLHGFALLNTQQVDAPVYRHLANDQTSWFAADGVQVRYAYDVFHLESEAEGRLLISDTVAPTAGPLWPRVGVVWLLLTGIPWLVGAVIALALRRRADVNSTPPVQISRGWKALLLAFAFGAATHILLVANSPVLWNTGDSTVYMLKALALVEHGTYDAAGPEYELNRLPGYPFLLATFLRLLGYNLTTLTLAQSILFAGSVLALALSMRRWVRPTVLAIGVLLALASPVQVWASRSIMTESTFAAFAALSFAALFEHIGTRGPTSKGWLLLFTLAATLAVFIRPNGAILFAVLPLLFLPTALDVLYTSADVRGKIGAGLRAGAPYLLSMALLFLVIGGWCARNYLKWGYTGPTDLTAVALLVGQTDSGTFDVRAIDREDLFEKYLIGKYQSQYVYHGWQLRNEIYRQLSAGDLESPGSMIRQLDESVRGIADRSLSLSPWQLRVGSLLGATAKALWWPDGRTYWGLPIRQDYAQFWAESDGSTRVRDSISRVSTKLIHDAPSESPLFQIFSRGAERYHEWYLALLIVASLSGFWLIWRGSILLALPWIAFLANIAMNVYLLSPLSRYVQVLDLLLVFQCTLAIDLLTNRISLLLPSGPSRSEKAQVIT